jgi:hypothetical protein
MSSGEAGPVQWPDCVVVALVIMSAPNLVAREFRIAGSDFVAMIAVDKRMIESTAAHA